MISIVVLSRPILCPVVSEWCAEPDCMWEKSVGWAASCSLIKGGGGDNGYFFVKLDFEIAVDQQTRTSDRTFEGVPDPNRQTVPAGQPRPYLVQIRPNLAKYPEHARNPYFMCSTCS